MVTVPARDPSRLVRADFHPLLDGHTIAVPPLGCHRFPWWRTPIGNCVFSAAILCTFLFFLLAESQRGLPFTPIFEEVNVTIPVVSRNSTNHEDAHQRIPADFIGLSFEWNLVQSFMQNPAFLAVVNATLREPHAPGPRLRVGGATSDFACWNPTELPAMRAAGFCGIDVTGELLKSVRRGTQYFNSSVVFGLNFRNGFNPREVAIGEAHAIGDWVGFEKVDAFEVGHEPDR